MARPAVVVVALTPAAVPAALAAGGGAAAQWTGIAVDVLRATSTLTVARAHGVERIVPLATPEDALALRAAQPGVLACGERGGRIVPGFDLGNSPAEYTRERVAGRTLAFASTNGSQAMLALAGCEVRWLGAFVGASALLGALADARAVCIACAGKEGAFALEDAACAGWLVERLVARGAEPGNSASRLCAALAPRDAGEVRTLVEGSEHGRYLAGLGADFARDVAFCATLDAVGAAHGF